MGREYPADNVCLHLCRGRWLLEAPPKQVCEEGRGIVGGHLLVVQGQAEQQATQAVPVRCDCSSSSGLALPQQAIREGRTCCAPACRIALLDATLRETTCPKNNAY